MASTIKEYHIDTDEFNQPRVSKGTEAIGVLLVRLLLLEPGTDPMRPGMGVGLVSKYRYMFPDKLSELKKDIYSQLETYLFPYQNVELTLSIEDKELRIDIDVNKNIYKYVTRQQEDNSITLVQLREEELSSS